MENFYRVPHRAASEIEQLNRFPCGGYSDESTIVYLQHPCKILTSLEVGLSEFSTAQGFCFLFFVFPHPTFVLPPFFQSHVGISADESPNFTFVVFCCWFCLPHFYSICIFCIRISRKINQLQNENIFVYCFAGSWVSCGSFIVDGR